jgi:hypothetical protein
MMRRPAFSYVEAVISVVILGSAVVTGLGVFGSYIKGVAATSEMSRSHNLASEWMGEILAKPFEDEDAGAGSFGRETGEIERVHFDDVDDYDGKKEKPPVHLNGDPILGAAGFQRWVIVTNVDDETMMTEESDGSTRTKQIVILVTKDGKIRARLRAFRTRYGWVN